MSITIHKWEDILTPGLQQLKARSFPQIQNTQYSWLDILRGLKAAFFFTARYQRIILLTRKW